MMGDFLANKSVDFLVLIALSHNRRDSLAIAPSLPAAARNRAEVPCLHQIQHFSGTATYHNLPSMKQIGCYEIRELQEEEQEILSLQETSMNFMHLTL